jgi:hypothetical protein
MVVYRPVTLKQRCLDLKKEGKSNYEIAALLGCRGTTVSYHVDPSFKARHDRRTSMRAKGSLARLKEEWGGKCEFCGFSECSPALHFHHIDPSKKSFGLSNLSGKSYESLRKEAEKCVLVCANCHHKLHGGLISITREIKARSDTRQSAPRHRKDCSGT